ncbi:MAG: PA14 domain-containing protein [Anaerolineae bacterium]
MQNPRPARESWTWGQEPAEEPSGGRPSYTVILLLLFAAIVVCITGFFVVRILLTDRQPVALPGVATSTPSLATAVPGVVLFFLRSPAEAQGEGYAYAAAVADDNGAIRTAFTFPSEMRWMNQTWAEVLARGTRSERQAAARFTLIAPSPTPTVPPPTPGPTLPATETPTPTNTPLPATATAPASFPDWRAEYFANESLGGDAVLVRNDPAIDFNWVEGSPDPRIPVDRFSARWTRQLQFVEGYYRFVLSADDGVRLWIDGQLAVDEWHDGVLSDYDLLVHMSGGQHSLRLEYYENLGGAMVQLRWFQDTLPTPSSTPTATWTPTPSPTPSPTEAPPTSTPTATQPPPTQAPGDALPQAWWGEYFNNPLLEGSAALQRQDARVQFQWGAGSPDPALPADGFSVRWTGDVWLPAGNYLYSLAADDGARLWIDGGLLIDAWTASAPGQLRAGHIQLGEGVHSFRVEYYEAHTPPLEY